MPGLQSHTVSSGVGVAETYGRPGTAADGIAVGEVGAAVGPVGAGELQAAVANSTPSKR